MGVSPVKNPVNASAIVGVLSFILKSYVNGFLLVFLICAVPRWYADSPLFIWDEDDGATLLPPGDASDLSCDIGGVSIEGDEVGRGDENFAETNDDDDDDDDDDDFLGADIEPIVSCDLSDKEVKDSVSLEWLLQSFLLLPSLE